MLFNGYDMILTLIAISKCVPSGETVGPTPLSSPQAAKISGDQVEKAHESPIPQPNPKGETVPPHNADDNNTLVSTTLAIEHNGSVKSFYKKFFNHMEKQCIDHYAFLYGKLDFKREDRTMDPVIINEFNISKAAESASTQLFGSSITIEEAQKYTKVLVETIVVLEHTFVQTKNEFVKLEEEAQQKIKNYNEKITSIQQGRNILKPGNKKPLTIEELNGDTTATQNNIKASKDEYRIRLLSIADCMDKIRTDLEEKFFNEGSLNCATGSALLPQGLFMSYEAALQFLKMQNDYEKNKNSETPTTHTPLVDEVILTNYSKGYCYEDFLNDLKFKLFSRSRLNAFNLKNEMDKDTINMDKINIENYNLTGAFKHAAEKIKRDKSTEKESMNIILKIVNILDDAYEKNKNMMDDKEVKKAEVECVSRTVKTQYYSNLMAINELMKEISNLMRELLFGPSHSNGYLYCCNEHFTLNKDGSKALAFLKQHPEYKDFIEELANSKSSDPPVVDDSHEMKIPTEQKPEGAEKEDPVQVVNNSEKEAVERAKCQDLAIKLAEILEDGKSKLAEINNKEENEALKQNMGKLITQIDERLKNVPTDENLKNKKEILQKNLAFLDERLKEIEPLEAFANMASRKLESNQKKLKTEANYNLLLNNMNDLNVDIEARFTKVIAAIKAKLVALKEQNTAIASGLENKTSDPNNKPTLMDKVDKHKGKIVIVAIGAIALIIVIIVVLRSDSKGVAVPEASI
ncbi:hypothetical protein ENBRE01_1587 [Enteropsectra breve]|nr:hypothetical protein ENBRE01_1587 [Enteropsectra breve]